MTAGSSDRRLALGIGGQALNLVAQTLMQMALVSAFLTCWPVRLYADWLVLQAGATLFSLADVGLLGYLGNRIRAAAAQGQDEDVRRILGRGLAGLFLLSAGWVLVLVWLAFGLGVAGGRDALTGNEGAQVFLLLGLASLVVLPRALVASVYTGRGQFGRETVLAMFLYVGLAPVQIAGLLAGISPVGLAWLVLGASLVLGWGPLIADLRRSHPDIALNLGWPARKDLVDWARQALPYGMASAAPVMVNQIPILMLGWFAPSSHSVVLFTTMRSFTGLARQAAFQIAVTTGMEMAGHHARRAFDEMAQVGQQMRRFVAALTGMLAGGSLVVGPAFFGIWTRQAVVFEERLAVTFLGGLVLTASGYVALSVLRHIHSPRPVALGLLAQVALTVVLCLALVPHHGADGAALAVVVAEYLVIGLYLRRQAPGGGGEMPAMARDIAFALAGGMVGWSAAYLCSAFIAVKGLTSLGLFGGAWLLLCSLAALVLLFDAGRRRKLMTLVRSRLR